MTLKTQYDQAAAARRRDDYARAERLYRHVLKAAPASFAARHMLGVLKAQTGTTAEALALIEAALALGLTVDSIPAAASYLKAEPQRVARWAAATAHGIPA